VENLRIEAEIELEKYDNLYQYFYYTKSKLFMYFLCSEKNPITIFPLILAEVNLSESETET
jgi:hypothetical protein